MINYIKKIILLVTLICCYSFAQKTSLDWKMHNVGKVRQVITNTGAITAVGDALFNFSGLINSEYPPNSFEEHIIDGGIWVGAIVNGQKYVSVTEGEGSSKEFYPSENPWDTIWAVKKGDTVDIPYWKKYAGVSDQDFVCKYNDYGPASIKVSSHTPLYLDVIQNSYAWSSKPMDEFIVINYHIIPTKFNLDSVYLTTWFNGNVGYISAGDGYALDDESFFRQDKMLMFCRDVPGGADGEAIGPIAERPFPPKNKYYTTNTTFIWYNGRQQGLPSLDAERYDQMASGTIMEDQFSSGDGTKCMVSFGPFKANVGDTLHFTVGIIMGKGYDGVIANASFLEYLVGREYKVPSPPPPPPLKVETRNHKVILKWDVRPGETNPEKYTDPYRADGEVQPFEGYRIYKSTKSISGPWTLMAEFDIPGNKYNQNTGLVYEFTDQGLLNNFDYYYTATAFSKEDKTINFPSLESSLNANSKKAVPGPEPPSTVGRVAVVPNPYRGDIAYHSYNPPWEKPQGSRDRWMEQDRRVQFINLPSECEIKIYTLSGDIVNTIYHNNPSAGYEDWNMTSYVGQAISSGIYLFSVKDSRSGDVQVGKFIIIK